MGNRRQRNSYYVQASNKVRGGAETNRGQALNHWQKQTVRTLFRADTDRGRKLFEEIRYILFR